MAVSYNKLWKILIDRQMSRTELKKASGISTNVLAKLGRNQNVSMDSLEKICITLSCDIGNVMEIIPQSREMLIDDTSNTQRSVKIFDSSYEYLKKIDWSFPANKQNLISRLHPYPARFIEELPRQLIKALKCPPGAIILDPFCGSGTTLVEAQRIGIESIGVDLNPIACLISKVKTAALDSNYLTVAQRILKNARQKYSDQSTSIPDIPNLDHWFKKDVQYALSALISEISSNKICNATKDALLFSLSSVIVRVSNQDSDTRYAAIDKHTSAEDVFDNFISACRKLEVAKQEVSFDTAATVIEKDILSVSAREIIKPVGLVITSPPYPNAYEYWLYHKYRMWWLGYDPLNVRSFEIGARPHYQKKNGQTEKDFETQMDKVFALFDDCVVADGHVCIIIGRSIIKGRCIDNCSLIKNIAIKRGYALVADIPREIASSRKSFNLTYGKITTENILIFKKG